MNNTATEDELFQRRTIIITLLCGMLIWGIATPCAAPAAPASFNLSIPAVTTLGQSPFGLNTHIASRYGDRATMNVPADVVAQSGAGWAREDVQWWRIQPTPDTWDWSFTDAAFNNLKAHNIQIVGVIAHPPGWATPYPNDGIWDVSFYAPDPDKFAAFTQAVVMRYGNIIHHWEIWNEPDNTIFWKPAPDPAAYATLLKKVYPVIHAADPQAQVILGGINPFANVFLPQIAAQGAWNSFDILGIHPYVDPTAPEAGNIGGVADLVRSVTAKFGQKPIWVTEIGWASGPSDRDLQGRATPQDQANYLVRAAVLLWRAGIERIFWYTLKDADHNPYGLVGPGSGRDDYGTLKPVFYAFRTLNQQFSGATFFGLRDLFQRTNVFDFEALGVWRRGDQSPGAFTSTTAIQHGGQTSAMLNYTFNTSGNDYIVFARDTPIPVPGTPYALGMWVYGDGTGNTLKVRLRDVEGETLQYSLGPIGAPGWRFMQVPISKIAPEWTEKSNDGHGNGRLDFPVSLAEILVDDQPDSFAGTSTIYLDDLTTISGPEGYDLQLQRNGQALDLLWSPEGQRARMSSAGTTATLTNSYGVTQNIAVNNGQLVLDLGPAPMYLQHQR